MCCPAVALAWRLLAADCGDLLAEVVAGAAGPENVAALLVHQASLLHLLLHLLWWTLFVQGLCARCNTLMSFDL